MPVGTRAPPPSCSPSLATENAVFVVLPHSHEVWHPECGKNKGCVLGFGFLFRKGCYLQMLLIIFITGQNYIKWPSLCAEELRTSIIFSSKHIATYPEQNGVLFRKEERKCVPTKEHWWTVYTHGLSKFWSSRPNFIIASASSAQITIKLQANSNRASLKENSWNDPQGDYYWMWIFSLETSTWKNGKKTAFMQVVKGQGPVNTHCLATPATLACENWLDTLRNMPD